ncbi:Ras family protein, partial [Entamoeba invadens IP1]
DRLRPLSYSESDVILLCFSVNSRTSYENIASKWEPEVRHYIPTAKTILVGLKIDLREEGNKEHTSQPEGTELAKKLGCVAYLEASSVKLTGLKEVFNTAIDCVFSQKDAPKTAGGAQTKATDKKKEPSKEKGKCSLQ